MGRRSEQVFHLKSAAAVVYVPSWLLDVTASRLSSTLTTVSTFSLEVEKRTAETEQQRDLAGEQLTITMAERKRLL